MNKRALSREEALARIEKKRKRKIPVLLLWVALSLLGLWGMKYATEEFIHFPDLGTKEEEMVYFVKMLYLFGGSFAVVLLAPILLAGKLPTHEETALLNDLTKVEPDGTGQPMQPARKSENHWNH